MTVEFHVVGIAQPKGSTRAFQSRGMKFPIVTDSNRSARSWSQLVAQAASEQLQRLAQSRGIRPDAELRLLTGAVRISIAFALPRPASIKAKPIPHLKKPDVDKLSRCVLDALSGVVFRDDSQVVELRATKRYASIFEHPNVSIRVDDEPVGALFAERLEECRL